MGLKRKPLLAIAVGLLIILGLAFATYRIISEGITLRIPESTVAKRITKTFPIKRSNFFLKTTYSNPRTQFLPEQNSIQITLDADIKILNALPTRGTITLITQIDYLRSVGQIRLKNPKVQNVDIIGLATQELALVRDLIKAVSEATLSGYPIYTFDPSIKKEAIAKKYLKSIQIQGRHLVIEVAQ